MADMSTAFSGADFSIIAAAYGPIFIPLTC